MGSLGSKNFMSCGLASLKLQVFFGEGESTLNPEPAASEHARPEGGGSEGARSARRRRLRGWSLSLSMVLEIRTLRGRGLRGWSLGLMRRP